jgi:hypothetical protein
METKIPSPIHNSLSSWAICIQSTIFHVKSLEVHVPPVPSSTSRSSQRSVPLRLTHQKPISVASNVCHMPFNSELLKRSCSREYLPMLCDIFLFVGWWVNIILCWQFGMQPWYSFPSTSTISYFSDYIIHLVSCYVIAVFGCNVVHVKCDVETNYMAFQAKAGDVTRYHADGKQPVPASRTYCCAL